tara:strand:+ start:7411 stop:8619 length:1209 start_codon:yes stop_codon:yes gene_type:complete
MALVVAAFLIMALRRVPGAQHQAAEFDRKVYLDQLREIERDKERGVVGPQEAQRLHSEVARRLLEADRAVSDSDSKVVQTGPQSAVVAGVVALVIAAGFGLYLQLGAPGMRDAPLEERLRMAEDRRADRMSQEAIEAVMPPLPSPDNISPEFLDLVEKLREAVANRPDDLPGRVLLVRNEANLGNFAAASRAQASVIALKGSAATVDDRLMLATLMIQAAGGQVSPEAEAIFNAVLKESPKNDTALFFGGIVNLQVGRADLAFHHWKLLVETAPADSRWLTEVRPRMAELADLAGVRYTLPEAAAPESPLRGPNAADVQAATNMTPQEREAFIRTMVEGLGNRLASEGGTAAEWARLVGSLAALGEADRARAILAEATRTFAGREPELATILQAARAAGIAE